MEEEIKSAEPAVEDNEKKLVTTGEMVDYRESWRIFRIMSEFVEGFEFLGELKNEVTVLGSARLKPNTKYYKIAEELGRLLGKNGFTTITGGGPGIMEAANKGAYEAGGNSVGLNIQLPFEQRINPFVKKSAAFYYFFTRKVMLTSPANAFVFFPGGFGTMDEFFEVVDLIEMGHMPDVPIILVGSEFWRPLVDFMRKKSAATVGSLNEADLDKWQVVDDAESAFEFIKNTTDRPNINSPQGAEKHEAEWRIFRIMSELVDGFEFLTKVKNDVTVLGTKSILAGSKYYNAAYDTGKLLAKNQYAVVTGGGTGIMEAASKGAYESGGESIGINMRVKSMERRNNYLTRSIGFSFPFVRKLIITAPSRGFVFFPGGFGTMHQLFELLTLVETGKMEPMPLMLYDNEFWQPLTDFINKLYTEFKTISHGDQDLVRVINRPEDVIAYLK
ncbi:MAG: TIGR00730 family Rossman fold protein [Patescibacteria group bacterium]|nr:TIGR00730 family Rossman fold protein [Patescibacteria group bacterium]